MSGACWMLTAATADFAPPTPLLPRSSTVICSPLDAAVEWKLIPSSAALMSDKAPVATIKPSFVPLPAENVKPLVPVREIDDHAIGGGEPGPMTREIQRVFDDALHGRDPRYADWLDLVKVPTKAP